MKTLVTGGGGFLGGAIIEALLSEGHEVCNFSRSDYPNLKAKGVECFTGDLANYQDVHQAVQDCKTVFHVAALAGIWGQYQDYYRTNTLGTYHIIQACKAHNVKKLIYTSSPSVVHNGRDIINGNESLPYPKRFTAAYPQSKALAEQAVLAANSHNFSTIALRPHLIWGPGDNHLLPRIKAKARSGRLRFIGKPSALVDSTYITDAASAHLQAATALQPQAACAGKAYFISQGEPWPIDKLILALLATSEIKIKPKYINTQLAKVMGSYIERSYRLCRIKSEPPLTRFIAEQLSTSHWYDITAAKRDFGYQPQYSIESALNKLQHYLEQTASENNNHDSDKLSH